MREYKISGGLIRKNFLIGTILILFVWQVHGVNNVTLVEDGKSNAVIYVQKGCAPMTLYAAKEFQVYVEKTTGVRLSIKEIEQGSEPILEKGSKYVFIGESPFTKKLNLRISDLNPDGFRIVAEDNWIAILGRDYGGKPIGTVHRGTAWSYEPEKGISMYGETGTLFGVYHFLEEFCGIRWFMPGEIGEVVPHKSSLIVPQIDIKRAPYVDYRELMAYYIFGEDKESAVWYRRVGFGGSYTPSPGHSFQFFDIWAQDHPEYFYLDANKKPDTRYLFLDSSDVVEAVTTYIQKYFDEHPEVKVFPLEPKDYPILPRVPEDKITDQRFKGKANESLGLDGRTSDYLWRFVNTVAQKLYKTYPDRMILTLAYGDHRVPPPSITKFSPNLAVMICMMTSDHANDSERELFYREVKEWHKRSKHIYFWDYAGHYYYGMSLPFSPYVYPRTIAREFKDLKKILGNDWKGIFFEAECGRPQIRKFINREMLHLNYYVFAKCLWNPDLDIDALLNDYYEKFFGPAKEEMKEYYELAERLYTEKVNAHQFKGRWWGSGFTLVYSLEETEKFFSILSRAKEKAEDSIYGERISLILNKIQEAKKEKENAITSKYLCVPLGRKEGILKEEGLVAYWRFDEGEGNIIRDSSGYGNDGIAYQTKWLNTPLGSALEFNGIDSGVEIRYPKPELQPKQNITLMGWFYFDEELELGTEKRFGLIWTDNYSYGLHGYMDHLIYFTVYNEQGSVNRNFGFGPLYLTIPGWNHIAGSYDGKYLRIYHNGKLRNEERFGGNIRYSGDGKPWEYFKEFKITLGASNFKTPWQQTFKGRIDEVKIYNRTLTEEEIRKEFERGKEAFSRLDQK